MTLHYPKGSLCGACRHAARNCYALPFDQMKPIRRDADGAVAVRCTGFKMKEKTNGKAA